MNTLRELQLAELQVLKAFADACDRLGLTYYLNSGTLLGAVRHGGFIPWDDDVDVAMPFEDYERFLSCGQDALGDGFFIQNMETEPNFHFSFTRVRKNGTTCLNSYHRDWHIHHGVWIDVFPIVTLSGKRDFKRKHRLFSFCNLLQMDDFLNNHIEDSRKELGGLVVALLKVFYLIPRSARIRWHRKLVKAACGKKNGNCYSVLWGNITSFYPENVFAEKAPIRFEDALFSAPADPDRYLTYTYGDYMKLPPENKRRSHTVDIVDLDHDYRQYVPNR